MDLRNILAISGRPGLYQVSAQMKNGVVVESLIDGKKFPTYAAQQVSALEEISIYCETEDVPLKVVFRKIYEKEDGKVTSVSPKTKGNELRDYFLEILPEFDQERVYNSDIKKVLTWYNLLLEKGILTLEEAAEETATESVVEDAEIIEETEEKAAE